jgi:hypothetical protein
MRGAPQVGFSRLVRKFIRRDSAWFWMSQAQKRLADLIMQTGKVGHA